MANSILLYVELEGKVWAILEDGSWLSLQQGLPNSINVPFIPDLTTQLAVNEHGEQVFYFQGKSILVDQAQLDSAPQYHNLFEQPKISTPGYKYELYQDAGGGSLGQTTRIKNDGDEVIAEAGFETRGDIVQPQIIQEEYDASAPRLPKDATISIVIEDGSDTTINQYEIPSVLIHGETFDVENGREVIVTVTDQDGNSLTFSSLVTDNFWTLEPEDLSRLSEGPITAIAEITDFYGNFINTQADSNIDTLADINIEFADAADDNVINAYEQSTETLSGDIENVEDGQTVQVLITDMLGNTQQLTASVSAGSWEITDDDLSGLSDGLLTATATVEDIAGNIATSTTTIIKDSLAEMTLFIDSGEDDWLNADEITAASFSGTVIGVEDGQTVTILTSDSDGKTQSFTTTVVDSTYQIDNLDLTGISDGTLTVVASVSDLARNVATATSTVEVDTSAFITVNIHENGDDYINAQEVSSTTISGFTVKVDTGETITITVTDSQGKSLQFTTVSSLLGYSITEDLSPLAEGELTVVAEVVDVVGNAVTASDTTIKDTQAELTFTVDDGGDGWLNAQEVLSASGFGDATDIEDGQTVMILATDSTGVTASIETTIIGGAFSVDGLDVSHFAEGEFTVVVSATDIAGNVATADDIVEIDTQASLTLSIESHGDGVLNTAEVGQTKLSGVTVDVEDGETVTIVVTDDSDNSLTFQALVSGSYYEVSAADLSSLNEGQLTAVATVTDIHGNSAEVTAHVIKDTLADITLELDGNGDQWLNVDEVLSLSGSGTVSNVEDGQTVTIVATDNLGNSASINTVVVGGNYNFSGLDLSDFTQGEFTAVATVNDLAGNTATAEDTLSIDTLASITVNLETGSDDVLNAEEVVTTTINGTTTEVENGATVSISVTDVDGKAQDFFTTVLNGSYSITDLDLSALAEGELVVEASVTDAVGNDATASDSAIKDTLASITIDVDSGADSALNANEITQTHIFGSVSNIEDGQTVTVVVSDGSNNLNFTAVVIAGGWSLDSEDLSSLNDGELTFSASVSDIAGNIAMADASKEKDTLAEVTIQFEQENKDGVLSADESTNERLSGNVSNIENGRYLNVTVTDTAGNSINLTAQVILQKWIIPNNDLTSLVDGEITAVVEVSDLAGNIATAATSIIKDTSAEITVEIETLGDGVINADEVSVVDIHGATTGIEDGQTVTLTITDINGNTLATELNTTVSGGIWSIEDVDLSSLDEGQFTVIATTEDLAGNSASASDQAIKDVLADITINIHDHGDGYLNAVEVPSTTISGSVKYVEDGQTVLIDITDINGDTISTSAIVSGGLWQVDDLDLSALAEGELVANASVTDLAGNTATSSDTDIKDSLASLTVSIDSGGDGLLNADEVSSVMVFGTTIDVEKDQIVSFTISDGVTTSGPFIAEVLADGTWSRDGMDFSDFSEGDISVNATVSDLSGNSYDASASVEKDTLASITIEIKTNSDVDDNVINAQESTATEISGTVSNVEDGQIVSITVNDGAGGELLFTTSVSGGVWILPGVDLSSLTDGDDNITATASVGDTAGNSATASDSASKDTLASIEVHIESGDDELLNAGEIAAVSITGSVTNIEDGQTVTLTISDQDNNQMVVTAEVLAGVFVTATDLDLSGFSEGQVQVIATVTDIAGNSATATDDTVKDTQLSIDIDTNNNNGFDGYNTFNSYAFMNGTHTEIGGTTTAEAGQVVTVTIDDGSNSVDFTGVVDSSGRWLVEGIDISSLDNTQAWSVIANVEDIAGNTTSDEMPDLKLLDAISFSEDDLNVLAVSGDIALEVDSVNTNVFFTDEQPQLETITSEGQSVFSDISDDGLIINVYRESDGQLVFKAIIDSTTSSVNISMFAPLDHALDSDSLITELFVKAVQTDDDGTIEESTMPLIFEVIDSGPDAEQDIYEVVEATTSSDGNLLDNDSAVDGDPVVNSVIYDGVTQSVSVGSDAVFNTDKGQLQVSVDGSWIFIAASNLDNTTEQYLDFEYEIIDLDGDISSAAVSIIIVDGAAGDIDDFTGVHSEPTVAVFTGYEQTFIVNAGSDDLLADSVQFTDISLELLNAQGLTSNGEAVTFTFSADNATIIGESIDGTVLTLSLSAVSNGADLTGTFNVDQLLPIDHLSNDKLSLEVGVYATDSDGTDTSTASVVWSIHDGADASIDNTAELNIDEVDLSSGNVTGSGTLQVDPGSDNTTSIAFDISKQPDLTSGGEAIQYRLNGDVLEGYIGTEPDDTLIFDITLTGSLEEQSTSSMGYDFTLYQSIDELDADGEHIDTLPIGFVVSVTDGDNDITDQTLMVNVTDSSDPIITGNGFDVSEEPQAPTTPPEITATDTTVINITADQDPVNSLTVNVVNGQAVTLDDGTAVMQSGEALVWQVNDDGVYNGVLADGTIVFSLTLPNTIDISAGTSEDITLTLDLIGAIDHDKSTHDNNLEIVIPLLATDSDNSSFEYDITAYVVDGHDPSVSFVNTLTADENDTLDGTSNDTVNYTIDYGSDEVVSVQPILAGQVIDGLTSNGNSVTFSDSVNDNGWWTASSSEGNVFRIRFNLDGTVDLKLLGAVDHPDSTSADTLSISLDVEVYDADGDSTNSTINIDIVDDVPDIKVKVITLEEGTTEQLNLLENGEAGADGGAITTVTVEGKDYTPGDVIDLFALDGTAYGTIQINSDGSGELITFSDVNHEGLNIYDEVTYTVVDNDGDSKDSYLVLDIADQTGDITIANTDFLEDVPQILELKVSVGDEDNGEKVEEIIFDKASLLGGVLTFNGVELSTNAEGDYVLDGSDLVLFGGSDSIFVPDGDLVLTPLLNSSDQTQTLELKVSAVISRDVGEDETVSNDITFTVTSVADAPTWDDDNSAYEYSLLEDDGEQTLSLSSELFDIDGSEVLNYVIGDIDEGLTLTLNGTELISGDSVSASDVASIQALIAANSAGTFAFDITPLATESENSDAASGETKNIVFNVQAVADKPDLTVIDAKGVEDTVVLLNQALNGELNDDDGSESLSYIITVADGWSVVAVEGSDALVTEISEGVYSVLGTDVDAGEVGLLPAANVSSVTGTFEFTAQAVATDSTQDGQAPDTETSYSDVKSFVVFITGVVDAPIVSVGGDWAFDSDTQVISNSTSIYEDQLINLDIDITTVDQDGSESINLLLSDIPQGFMFTDASGNTTEVAISSLDGDGNPIYQVSLEDLSSLYLKPVEDYSGTISFNIETIITEADGDAEPDGVADSDLDDSVFNLTVEIDIIPVIDMEESTIEIRAEGAEDHLISVNLMPAIIADSGVDIDASEEVTAFTIESLDTGCSLYFDGIEITVPVDVSDYIDITNDSLSSLLESGRFAIQAPTDANGDFNYNINYEVTDISESGETVTQTFNHDATLTVHAQVEDLTQPGNEQLSDATRLEGTSETKNSDDGSAISLDGSVLFYDQDDDGSEHIDYIVIQVPDQEGWVITHDTNTVIYDGNGRWLIDASGLTSTSTQEDGLDLLAGTTVYFNGSKLLSSTLQVSAHVEDGADKEMIETTIQVHFSGDETDSDASDIDSLQIDYIEGEEDTTIDIGSQINIDVSDDTNDLISFKVYVSDLPYGGAISGSEVIAVYDSDGKNIVYYLFTEASLSSLALSGIDEDFSGIFEVPITTISTDSDSGNTIVDEQTLQFEISPIVDGLVLTIGASEVIEDTLTLLDLTASFDDSNLSEQGVESLTGLTLTLVDGGTLSASSGVLTETNDGVYVINDLSKIDEIYYQGPLNVSGEVSIGYSANIVDTATGYDGDLTNTENVTGEFIIDITPVTDNADLTVDDIVGDEDTYIDLSELAAELSDSDGSEIMSIVITGMPSGAVLVSGSEGAYTVLANNGTDGGSFNGQPTYSWTVTEEQFATLAILPQLDFSGDIPLQVEAVTYESGTQDYVTTQESFTLEVNPIADDAVFTNQIDVQTGVEGQVTEYDLTGVSTETDSNETLILSVTVEADSDSTALYDLDRIRVGSDEASFTLNDDGSYTATLEIDSNQLDGFELLTGSDAFGLFNVEIALATKDTATVGGAVVEDIGDASVISTTLELTAQVDAPILTLEVDSIFTQIGADTALPITLELVNPDLSNEVGYVEITGVPDGATISNATQSNSVWTILQEDLDSALLQGLSLEGEFELIVTPYDTLDGQIATTEPQTLEVNVAAENSQTITGDFYDNQLVGSAGDDTLSSGLGSDLLYGGAGNDTFVFTSDEQGSVSTPAIDTIKDFEVGNDSINISDLYVSSGDSDVSNLISIEEVLGSTVLNIMFNGTEVTQQIVIESTSVAELYGSDTSGVSEVEILNQLIEDQTLVMTG